MAQSPTTVRAPEGLRPGVVLRLLGRPSIARDGAPARAPRGRKAWALLAHLLLTERPVGRRHLAELLFGDAADPLGALRWNLAELRGALDAPDALRGDPVALALPPGAVADVHLVTAGRPVDAAWLTDLGGELLEGMAFPGCPAFESWLLVQRQHLAGAVEALLREATLDRLGVGDAGAASTLAARAVAANPFAEAHWELLVRSLAQAGQGAAARAQVAACEELFRRELGVDPSPAVRRAARVAQPVPLVDRAAAEGQLEAGKAAMSAGAVETGLDCLREARSLAHGSGDRRLEARALLALGTGLVHAVRGRDEEGAAALHRALALADEAGDRATAVGALRELGYVDVQAGRRERAAAWLARAEARASGDAELASIAGFIGMNLSDMADYPAALAHLGDSVARAERAGDRRQAAFSLSLVGRLHLLRGDLGPAAAALDRCLALVEAERWLAFVPWPETLRAELDARLGRIEEARGRLEHAFTMACHLGDPCWEGISARATAHVELARGRAESAQAWLEQARTRCTRVPDRYEWLHAHILDALAEVAIARGDPVAPGVVDALTVVAARASMRELLVRALVHRWRLGQREALVSARELAGEIESPALATLVAGAGG